MIRTVIILALAATLFAAFCFLGTWQLERRAWKLNLIEQVNTQMAQPPSLAPGPEEWFSIEAADAYRPVKISGQFLHDKETLVGAMTAYGSGYWLLTPLQTEQGYVVLINRGFVPLEMKNPESRQQANLLDRVEVTGLLRITEPKGRTLQKNDPSADRWYSRDVVAISQARGLTMDNTAPYFIDADGTNNGSNSNGWPVGGLTVVKFRNTHLVYALTWFSLAGLTLFATWIVLRVSRD